MKRKLIAFSLGFLILLTACSKKNEETNLINTKDTENQIELDKENNTLQQTENKLGTDEEAPPSNSENSDNNELDQELDEQDEQETDEEISLKDNILALKEDADYISVIKMSQTGSTGKEITIIEDLKGSLKNIVMPDIDNLEANQTYLIFLKDSDSGDIILVNDDEGLIKIKDEYDEPVVIIRESNEKKSD